MITDDFISRVAAIAVRYASERVKRELNADGAVPQIRELLSKGINLPTALEVFVYHKEIGYEP